MTFRDGETIESPMLPIPLTVNQAIATIDGSERGWSFQDHNSRKRFGELALLLDVDLTKVDMSVFEAPVLE
jgi:hypothetical protein